MKTLYFVMILIISASFGYAQESFFQGRVDLVSQIRDFSQKEPSPGVLYLLTGAASSIKILSEAPFSAEAGYIQGFWEGDEDLKSFEVELSFMGDGWKDLVKAKKPREGFADKIYPYQRFMAAVQLKEKRGKTIVFKVLHIQILP